MAIEFAIAAGRRRELLAELGVRLPESGELHVDASTENLETLLLCSRAHCLSEDELYFLQRDDELRRPLNHRNEAAAVSLLLQRLPRGGADAPALRALLSHHCQSLWPDFASGDVSLCGREPPPATPAPPGTPTAEFLRWAGAQGVEAAVEVATFGGLRGCVCTRDVAAGDTVLSIPQDALMYDDTVRATDVGRMLSAVPDLEADNLLILFTLIDRWDADSRWAPFWRALPSLFQTGLSFPPWVAAALEGTAAALELRRGQAHLRAQFEATRPLMAALLRAYPQHLEAEWFEYGAYVWAAELWYSYAFEIEFPPAARSKTVMVPFACLVNHSPWPHVVRYGRVDPAARALQYPAFRPAAAGAQAFISYGPVPNLKLLAYYGFAVDGNPHDTVAMTLEPPDEGLRPAQLAALERHGLGMEHSLRDGPLARPLLACLRVIAATDEELGVDPREGPLSAECEGQALGALRCAVEEMLAAVAAGLERVAAITAQLESEGAGGEEVRNENGLDPGWRASLRHCEVYLQGQGRILGRALQECGGR